MNKNNVKIKPIGYDQFRSQVERSFMFRVRTLIYNQVRVRVVDQIVGQVNDQVCNRVWFQAYGQVNNSWWKG